MRRTGGRVRFDCAILILAVFGSAAVLVWGAAGLPILLWDESRTMVNALEMARTGGWSLVTTYAGQADLWNTKPPLLIWLMRASIALFGPSELALRLPGMIATVGTLVVAASIVWRATRSAATAALALVLIALTPALFAEHGARTADYDSLLTFFTTCYLALILRALHQRRRRPALLAGIALTIAAAILTKSVAGMTAGVGLILYITLIRRWPRIVGNPGWWLSAAASAAIVAAFVIAREQTEPGYVAAVWANDIAGRYSAALNDVAAPPWHYLTLLVAGYVAGVGLIPLIPLAWPGLRARERLTLLYAACVAAGLLATISLAASRLNHYLLPAIPFFAITAALTLRGVGARFSGWRPLMRGAVSGYATVTLLLAVFAGVARRGNGEMQSAFAAREAPYGALLARLSTRGAGSILVVEPGFVSPGGPAYAPVLRAYRLIWAARGLPTRRVATLEAATGWRGIVASCDRPIAARLAQSGPDVAGVPGCVAIQSTTAPS